MFLLLFVAVIVIVYFLNSRVEISPKVALLFVLALLIVGCTAQCTLIKITGSSLVTENKAIYMSTLMQ